MYREQHLFREDGMENSIPLHLFHLIFNLRKSLGVRIRSLEMNFFELRMKISEVTRILNREGSGRSIGVVFKYYREHRFIQKYAASVPEIRSNVCKYPF